MTRAERRRAKRELEKGASREERKSRRGKWVAVCPICLRKFNTVEEVIEHQDMTGHVVPAS